MLKAKKKRQADWDSSKAERTFRKRNALPRPHEESVPEFVLENDDPETLAEIDAQNEELMDDYYQWKYPEGD